MNQNKAQGLPAAIPQVPDRLLTLDAMDLSTLQKASKKSEAYKTLFNNEPYVQELNHIKEHFEAATVAVTEDHKAVMEQLGHNRQLQRYRALKVKHDQIQAALRAKKEQLAALDGRGGLSDMKSRMTEMAHLAEDRADSIARDLLNGDTPLRQFTKDYVSARMLFYERAGKAAATE